MSIFVSFNQFYSVIDFEYCSNSKETSADQQSVIFSKTLVCWISLICVETPNKSYFCQHQCVLWKFFTTRPAPTSSKQLLQSFDSLLIQWVMAYAMMQCINNSLWIKRNRASLRWGWTIDLTVNSRPLFRWAIRDLCSCLFLFTVGFYPLTQQSCVTPLLAGYKVITAIHHNGIQNFGLRGLWL